MPQPNFVPVMRSESRSTHKRGVPGAASTARVLPLTTRETMKNLLGGRLNELAGWFLILFRPPEEVHTEAPRTQDPRMHYLACAAASFLPNPGAIGDNRTPLGRENELPAVGFARHRCAERA